MLTSTIRKLKAMKNDHTSRSPSTSASLQQLDQVKIKRIICRLCDLNYNSVAELAEHASSEEHIMAVGRYLNEDQEVAYEEVVSNSTGGNLYYTDN